MSTTDSMFETTLQAAKTLDICFIHDTYGVCEIYLAVVTLLLNFFSGGPHACSAVWELPRRTYFCRAVYTAAGLVDVCM